MKNVNKILIISGYNFNGTDATSITLRNLFSNYDNDKIAQIFINYSDIEVRSNENFFVIPKRNFKRLFSIIENKDQKTKINNCNFDIKTKVKLKVRIFNSIHNLISSYLSLLPFVYSRQLDKFIRNFKPDLIYTPLGEIPLMKLVLKISKKHNLPIIPHFMDDWISTKYSNKILLFIPKYVLSNTVHKILRKSKISFAISEKMALEYKEKYKKQFIPLMNCVEELNVQEMDKTEIIKFCYSGGLHLNRWKSLLFLCESLKSYPFIKPFSLTIFTKQSDWILYENLFAGYNFVKYGGFLPQESVMKELNNQNILVHIESFDKQIAKYTRLSISTKIPEYLSLKKAILAIGPEDIASIEYLKNNRCAFVIDKQDSNLINIELNKIINQDVYNIYSENAYQLFLKNHTQKSQQCLLMNNLIL